MLETQIPVYSIRVRTDCGTLNAASAGTLGADTNGVTICTAHATYGSRVTSLVANTDDTTAVTGLLYIKTAGGAIKPLGNVAVAINSGNTAAIPAVDCLLGSGVTLLGMPNDNTSKRIIHLGPGELLRVAPLANMTAAKKAYFTAVIEDYGV